MSGTHYTDDAGHERFIPARPVGYVDWDRGYQTGWVFDDAPEPGSRPCGPECAFFAGLLADALNEPLDALQQVAEPRRSQ